MCIAQKTTGSKTSIKTEIASQQQMLAFLRKDIRQNIWKTPVKISSLQFQKEVFLHKNKNGNRQKRATASRQKFVLLMEGAGKIPEKIQLYKRVLQKRYLSFKTDI